MRRQDYLDEVDDLMSYVTIDVFMLDIIRSGVERYVITTIIYSDLPNLFLSLFIMRHMSTPKLTSLTSVRAGRLRGIRS